MEDAKPKHDPAILALLEWQPKKRFRPNAAQKAWYILNGYTLRKRGRPPKDEPANIAGGRAARK